MLSIKYNKCQKEKESTDSFIALTVNSEPFVEFPHSQVIQGFFFLWETFNTLTSPI